MGIPANLLFRKIRLISLARERGAGPETLIRCPILKRGISLIVASPSNEKDALELSPAASSSVKIEVYLLLHILGSAFSQFGKDLFCYGFKSVKNAGAGCRNSLEYRFVFTH